MLLFFNSGCLLAITRVLAKCPDDILEREASQLHSWISRFMAEVRRSEGKPHLPKSLYQLLSRVLRFMHSKNPACPNFLAQGGLCFRGLAQLYIANKQVGGYANPEKKSRCIVFLLDLCMSTHHLEFLKKCEEASLVPPGLRIRLRPQVYASNASAVEANIAHIVETAQREIVK